MNESEFARKTRRQVLGGAALLGGVAALPGLRALAPGPRAMSVLEHGARGDGTTLDTAAFQKAIDVAATRGPLTRVLVPGDRRYLIGTIRLPGGVDLHLERGAVLLASLDRADYGGTGEVSGSGGLHDASVQDALIVAEGAVGLRISGEGRIEGRAREFMTGYDKEGEWWLPKKWRPKMLVLTRCRDLQISGITIAEAPLWTLHLLGCEHVLIEHITIQNLMDVPNCDGIDPDHSRYVEIRNCDITAGDDAIVVKASRQATDLGPSAFVHVHDCVLRTQDAGLKIGTETWSDIHDITFERCKILTSSRGLGIQLRDTGNVFNIVFRKIELISRYYSAPWWGRGEAISFTALPRAAGALVGKLHNVLVEDVTATAENSVRVCGSAESRVGKVTLRRVRVTLDKTTHYPGALYDNRPTTAMETTPQHDTPGFSVEHADDVLIEQCSVIWGAHPAESFSYAIEAVDTTGLKIAKLHGGPARAELGKAVIER